MMLELLPASLLGTLRDVAPIIAVIFGFQYLVLRRPLHRPRRVLAGFAVAILGLALFLLGLNEALFPLGRIMARQLTAPEFLYGQPHFPVRVHWTDFAWVYVFAAALGFSTTIAEPALLAVARKAAAESAGTLDPTGLRVAVAIGVAFGIALGTLRIVTGTPLEYYFMAGYVLVLVQTIYAPRALIPLAYDSGGVTTSTVTVPLVTALGLGLAQQVPGRSPLLDGFGLIAFASLFPIVTVLGYTQLSYWWAARQAARRGEGE